MRELDCRVASLLAMTGREDTGVQHPRPEVAGYLGDLKSLLSALSVSSVFRAKTVESGRDSV
jgi:hypothetical protein